MVDFVLMSAFLSLCVMFIWACMYEGMIFGFVRELPIPSFAAKPIYDCIICMTPWWGSLILFAASAFYGFDFIYWWPTAVLASGINVILSPIVYKLHDIG